MSFLLRRNLPLAYAGWYDSFERPVENPVGWPWVHLGDGTPADINTLGELHVPQNSLTTNGGGESYEFMPFTPNSGLELEMFWPVGGAAAQSYDFYFTDTWANIGATFQNAVGIRLFYRIGAAGGPNVYVGEYPSMWQLGTIRATFTPPAGAFGGTVTLRVWFDDDQWVRVWVNGTYLGSATLDPGYKLGPGRRCLRMVNGTFADGYIRWINHYDRPSSIPPNTVWQSQFFDDFNRSDGAVGNGWTQLGTAAAISSGSWAKNGTADESCGLIRDTGNTSGRMRIEATVGGASGINNTSDSGLVLCSNAAGTQGLSANIFGNQIFLSQFSSSLSGNPTFTDQSSISSGVTVNTGDKIAFTVYNGIAWIEINGTRRLYSGAANNTVPATNSWAGLRVERASSNYSNSWNDVRIYSGLG
ncbi:hypothetical protein [Nocardia africana]